MKSRSRCKSLGIEAPMHTAVSVSGYVSATYCQNVSPFHSDTLSTRCNKDDVM